MNPARSLAPALVTLQLKHLWIYLSAPIFGAFISVLACRYVHSKDLSPEP
jgi:aquaporin Z